MTTRTIGIFSADSESSELICAFRGEQNTPWLEGVIETLEATLKDSGDISAHGYLHYALSEDIEVDEEFYSITGEELDGLCVESLDSRGLIERILANFQQSTKVPEAVENFEAYQAAKAERLKANSAIKPGTKVYLCNLVSDCFSVSRKVPFDPERHNAKNAVVASEVAKADFDANNELNIYPMPPKSHGFKFWGHFKKDSPSKLYFKSDSAKSVIEQATIYKIWVAQS